jgi:uncharacterized membrane protein YeaQ/YmgE (transglycosylase-associated protein family)
MMSNGGTIMQIVYLIILGVAAGYVATRIMNIQTSMPVTIAIGVLGAVVGGVLLRAMFVVLGLAGGLIGAVLGAMLLIWIYEGYIRK